MCRTGVAVLRELVRQPDALELGDLRRCAPQRSHGLHARAHAHTLTHTRTHAHAHAHTHTHACVRVRAYTGSQARMKARTHALARSAGNARTPNLLNRSVQWRVGACARLAPMEHVASQPARWNGTVATRRAPAEPTRSHRNRTAPSAHRMRAAPAVSEFRRRQQRGVLELRAVERGTAGSRRRMPLGRGRLDRPCELKLEHEADRRRPAADELPPRGAMVPASNSACDCAAVAARWSGGCLESGRR